MLGVADDRFTIGKEVYYPFAVELHYFRVDKRYWSICFERIKRAGFRIISSAVPWNLHQDANKNIDFTGFSDSRKDLIVFLELAREFGFKVILRPGPWVSGQWPNGGLPQFLFSDLKIFARDSRGQELRLNDDAGVSGGYLPSYLHSHFQHFLRNYFKTFIETTRNYIHPRGPIFMVELDFETSFGHYLDPGAADYNPDVLAKYYPEFLMSIYEDIKKLNQAYREKAESFEAVEPPRNFAGLDTRDLPKVFDWFRFREHMLRTYLGALEELFKSYTVEPLFFRSLYFRHGDLLPAFNLVPKENQPMLGANIFPEGGYFDLLQKGRFLQGEFDFAWAASFVSGSAATERQIQVGVRNYPDGLRRFYLTAAMSSGFKGMNYYMFVDRDHWYGAPLAKDGTISSGYEVIKLFNAAILGVKLHELKSSKKICIIGNRMYQWLSLLDHPKEFQYVERLMSDASSGFCRDLMRLKLDYDIRETMDLEKLAKYDLVFVPMAEFMPAAQQEAIVELLKKGVNVVACGLMPKYDENFRECPILSRHLRLKTSLGEGIDIIKLKNQQFTSQIYGYILSTDPKVKKLATVNKKNVGVASSRYKGTFYLYTFNIGSGSDHNKMVFIEALLAENNISSALYCSDPSVDMALHKGEKRAVLYLVCPPAGELAASADTSSREVIIRVDLRKLGITSAKIKMTDLLAGEGTQSLKYTADSLKRGVPIKIDFPNGYMFLLDQK
ncbi:putative beta-galactosidase [Candidatus Zixiibacteriota bacterium]|nr:putative beta-galactosidase [candidate division Zixibacteria bacterium]